MTWVVTMAVIGLVLMACLVGLMWVVDARHAEHVAHDRGRFRQ